MSKFVAQQAESEELIEKLVGLFFEDLEIDAEAGVIEFLGRDGYFDPPVVAVQIFTIALVVDQIMGRRKRRFYHQVIHVYDLSRSWCRSVI